MDRKTKVADGKAEVEKLIAQKPPPVIEGHSKKFTF